MYCVAHLLRVKGVKKNESIVKVEYQPPSLPRKGAAASVVLKRLTGDLISSLDDSLKLEVLEWAAFYEHRLAMGSKEIFHLEAFVAKFMAIYKKYLNDMFADDF